MQTNGSLPAPGRYYFGYGCMLAPTKMWLHCSNSKLVGLARLPGWKWHINARGYANIIPTDQGSTPPPAVAEGTVEPAPSDHEDGDCVYGLLYYLPPEDEKKLDKYEGADKSYKKHDLEVEVITVSSSIGRQQQQQQQNGRKQQQYCQQKPSEKLIVGQAGTKRPEQQSTGGPSRTAGPSRSAMPPTIHHDGGAPLPQSPDRRHHYDQIPACFGPARTAGPSRTAIPPGTPSPFNLSETADHHNQIHSHSYTHNHHYNNRDHRQHHHQQASSQRNHTTSSSSSSSSSSSYPTAAATSTELAPPPLPTNSLGSPSPTPGAKVLAMVYVDIWRLEPEKLHAKYIQRINDGIEQAARWDLPESYVENVLRKYVPGRDEPGDVVRRYVRDPEKVKVQVSATGSGVGMRR